MSDGPATQLVLRDSRGRFIAFGLRTAAKRNPDQVSSIAAILKSTRPFARPAARTACSVTSVRIPAALFVQQIQEGVPVGTLGHGTDAGGQLRGRAHEPERDVGGPRAERRISTPGGRWGS